MELFDVFCNIEVATVVFKYKKVYINAKTTSHLVINGRVKEDINRRINLVFTIDKVELLGDLLAGDNIEYKFLVEAESTQRERDGYIINQYIAHSFELL